MGDGSTIEWTDATWNPLVGCSRVSPGCDHCYAVGVVHRGMSPQHRGLTIRRPGEPTDWTGEVRLVPHLLDQPRRWTKPRRIFVNSLSDLFHPQVLRLPMRPGATFPPLAEIFAAMVAAPQHTFQVLTKRPQLMAAVMAEPRFRLDVNAALLNLAHPVMPGGMTDSSFRWPGNLWMGTSVESDRYAFRADHLRATPAAVRWLSLEPLLGPLPSLDLAGIDWVVVGGESGPGARAMHPDWVRDIRDRCVAAGVPFFFKQWGNWLPLPASDVFGGDTTLTLDGEVGVWTEPPDPIDLGKAILRNVGKKLAGRELDGRTWDEMPAVSA